MGNRLATVELGFQIMNQGTPEQCQDCYKAFEIGCTLAARVLDRELNETEAIDLLRHEVQEHCPTGKVPTDACIGNDYNCSYESEE